MQVQLSRRGRAVARIVITAVIATLAACGGSGSTDEDGQVGPVDVAPVVTLQPADASVTAPGTATFTAAASGTPAPTVQWQRSDDSGATWTPVAGATSTSYTTAAAVAGDDGARFRAVFSNTAGSATSNAGRLGVATVARVPGLSLLAGDIGGYGVIDGTGPAARFLSPASMAADHAGNLYVGDCQAYNVRKITAAGVVTTLAGPDTLIGSGNGLDNSGHVDAVGTAARLACPLGLAVDAGGNVIVGDFGNGLVRKIAPDGTVTTIAGGGTDPAVVDGPAGSARIVQPIGVAVDSHGAVFVADQYLHSIRKIAGGVVSTFAGVSSNAVGSVVDGTGSAARFIAPQALTIDADDNLYVGDGSRLRKITPAAVVTTVPGTDAITFARGLSTDAAGNVYVADLNSNVIRKVGPAGGMTILAGTVRSQFTPGYADGTGASAVFSGPSGIAVGADGNVYVAETGNVLVRKITPSAVVTTFAGAPVRAVEVDGTGAAAGFVAPNGIAADPSGNLFTADIGGQAIRKLTLAGVATTYAGATDQSGTADGPAASARFGSPFAVAADRSGNVYVADNGALTLRRISPAGAVTTLAGTAGLGGHVDGSGAAVRFESLSAVATDAAGNVYVADSAANTIRKVTPAGVVTTLAGQADASGSADGHGTAATFNQPYGIAVDPSGNVLVADFGNHAVRRITPAGDVTTLAGNAAAFGDDDGIGAAARFRSPFGVTTDADGNAYVSDLQAYTVRKITPAGVVTTLVGRPGLAGIRLGTDNALWQPRGVAWLPTGQLAIASADAVLLFTLP